MKKLLSILTITTLTASIPVSLLANTPLTRVKRDVSPLTFKSNNGYLPIKIATSPYQKETINKTNTNYQQTNKIENLSIKSEIISNDIYTNLLVVDINIELLASVGWNGSDTENKVVDLGETKKYDINITWNKIKENLSLILLKGSFEWNNYASPQKETELYLQFDAALSSESQLVYRKNKTVTATTGWAKQDGTISIKLIISKVEDNYANLKIKICVSADSYGAVHNNNTFIKCLIIELKK